MAQSLTLAEIAAIASNLQVGPDKRIQAELEIDWVLPGWTEVGSVQDLNLAIGVVTGYTNGLGPAAPSNPNNVRDGNSSTSSISPNGLAFGDPAHPGTSHRGWVIDLLAAHEVHTLTTHHALGTHQPDFIEWSDDDVSWTPLVTGTDVTIVDNLGLRTFTLTTFLTHRYWRMTDTEVFAYTGPLSSSYFESFGSDTIQVNGVTLVTHDPEVRTATYQVETLTTKFSRGLGAPELDATLDNVSGGKGYYRQANPIFVPNNPCRAYAWHGDRANRVQIFTGLLDIDVDDRDPDVATVEITAMGRTKLLLDPHKFIAIASQDPADADADRTEANGVFLNRSPEYIAGAALDAAGWPTADRDLATSGFTIPEYRFSDGGAWIDQVAGSGKLTEIAVWDFREDELGVIHFGPNILASPDEPDPDWTFDPGLNVLAYHHQVDDQDRVTRVRVSGPMTTTVPKWAQEWATTQLKHPVGTMYRPGDPDYIYVVDRVTQYLNQVRQSDRKVVARWYLGASLTNEPIGLSGDPTDDTTFYVLDAHLPGSGIYTNCKVRKFTFATKALASTTTLADGQWSDMKFDGSHLWLTNFGDDKLYEKTFVGGGAAGATASFSYAGLANPTGMYLDGTTIGLFFNGGAAFHLVDTSAPGTITGTQSTKGTHIEGGEADTTTHTDLYATAEAGDFGNTAGYVWKFQLAEDISVDVVKWATDSDLEDALGLQSGVADRVHDLHPDDPAHPWESRIQTVTIGTINTEDQAQAVADGILLLAKRLTRTQDLVTIGNPGIQLDDAIGYDDPVAASDAIWMLDSYENRLDAGTFATSMSALPWEAVA